MPDPLRSARHPEVSFGALLMLDLQGFDAHCGIASQHLQEVMATGNNISGSALNRLVQIVVFQSGGITSGSLPGIKFKMNVHSADQQGSLTKGRGNVNSKKKQGKRRKQFHVLKIGL